MEKNSVHGGQPEILALTHVLERPSVVHFKKKDKTTESGGFFNPIAYGILRLSQLRGWDFDSTPHKTMLKLFD